MPEIIRVYRESAPALTLVGKVYYASDRGENGTYSHCWEAFFANGWFDTLSDCGKPNAESGYVGAMRMNGKAFEYWIGIPMQSVSAVPEGFATVALPAGDYAVAWIKGQDDARLYAMHEACMRAFKQDGMQPAPDAWYIERYACPRFTQPDENGEVILDYMVSLA